jgi:hypothetical protein
LFEKYPDPPDILPFTQYTQIIKVKELADTFADWLVQKTQCCQKTADIFAHTYIENPHDFITKLNKQSDKIKDYEGYLNILAEGGYHWCYFFLDQMEESINNSSKKEIIEFTTKLKRVILSGSNRATLIATLHQSSMMTLMDNPEAKVNIVSFGPLDQNHYLGLHPENIVSGGKIIEFTETYLSEFRSINPNTFNDKLFPFEPRVVKYVVYISKGNLRDILRILHTLLRFATDKNQNKIDIDFVVREHDKTIGKPYSEDLYNEFKVSIDHKK